MSQDGRNWARIEGEHHSGALFDAGEGSEWDAAFVAAPMVSFLSGTEKKVSCTYGCMYRGVLFDAGDGSEWDAAFVGALMVSLV